SECGAMKALKMLLRSEGVDTSSLRVLFEQEGATTLALTGDGWDTLDLWLKLRDLVPKTRRWPLMLGQPGEEDLPTKREEEAPTVASILAEAEKIDRHSFFDRWQAEMLRLLREDIADHEAKGSREDAEHLRELLQGPEEYQGVPRGKWP